MSLRSKHTSLRPIELHPSIDASKVFSIRVYEYHNDLKMVVASANPGRFDIDTGEAWRPTREHELEICFPTQGWEDDAGRNLVYISDRSYAYFDDKPNPEPRNAA